MKWIKTFEGFEEIDIEDIESAFLSLKDEFDLVKMTFEQFKNILITCDDDFNDSYMIEYLNGVVSVTIFIKSKNKKLTRAFENLEIEYPILISEIKDFIYIVESSENKKNYTNIILRKCSNLTYYHITISFY